MEEEELKPEGCDARACRLRMAFTLPSAAASAIFAPFSRHLLWSLSRLADAVWLGAKRGCSGAGGSRGPIAPATVGAGAAALLATAGAAAACGGAAVII